MSGSGQLGIPDYIRIVRRRKRIILLSIAATIVSFAAYAQFQTPIYSSRGVIRVEVSPLDPLLSRWMQRNMPQLTAEATSSEVCERALAALGRIKPGMSEDEISGMVEDIRSRTSVSTVENTLRFVFYVESSDAESARDEADAMMASFEAGFREAAVAEDSEKITFLEERMNEHAERIAEIQHNLQELAEFDRIWEEYSGVREEEESLEEEMVANSVEGTGGAEFEEMRETLNSAYSSIDSIRSQIDEQERVLRDYVARDYTSRHPLVIHQEEQISMTRAMLLESMERERQSLAEVESGLRSRLSALSGIPENTIDRETLRMNLETQISLNHSLYQDLANQREELEMTIRAGIPDITVVERPRVSGTPVRRNTINLVAMGGVVGLLLGLGLSLLAESMDTSIATVSEIEETSGLKVLGVIPRIRIKVPRRRGDEGGLHGLLESSEEAIASSEWSHLLPSVFKTDSVDAEAYRTLATQISFEGITDGSLKSLLVTSSGPQEGKSTTAVNLAITLARREIKTLIVSANLRRPTASAYLRLPREPGLTDLILGEVSPAEAINENVGIENLSLLPRGKKVPNPAEVIASPAMGEIFRGLRENYDFIVVDCPPILPVSDSLLLSRIIDAVIIVYFVGHAPREAFLRSKDLLDNAGANILGVVLNNIPPEGTSDYSYYSYYYQES